VTEVKLYNGSDGKEVQSSKTKAQEKLQYTKPQESPGKMTGLKSL